MEAFFLADLVGLHFRVLRVDFVGKCAFNGIILFRLILPWANKLHSLIDTGLDKGDSSLGLIVYDNFFYLISFGE